MNFAGPEPELIEPDPEPEINPQPQSGSEPPSDYKPTSDLVPEPASDSSLLDQPAEPESDQTPGADFLPPLPADHQIGAHPLVEPVNPASVVPDPQLVSELVKTADSGRQSRWGWLLVVGPLVVAVGIILWFQFRVLPAASEDPELVVIDLPPPETTPTPDVPPVTDPPETNDPNPEPDPETDPEDETSDPEDNPEEDPQDEPGPDEPPPPEEPDPIDPTQFQQFGRQAFINLFDQIGHLPNLTAATSSSITGDADVDQRLRTLANQAGYLSQPVPAGPDQLVGVHQLQPLAATAWDEFSRAAETAGQPLTITLGHLSLVDQARLLTDQLDDDYSDESLRAAFRQVMMPGYSRHQTGFAIDIVAANDSETRFQDTAAYDWLAANNFTIAKHFGFVPSQPDNNSHGRGEHLVAFELVYIGRGQLLVGVAR